VLHFATHAEFEPLDPLASRLQLPDGSWLAAHEIASLRLQARLVYLSACSNAEGASELSRSGLSSLASAFQGAGASSVVGAFWPIEDRAASELALAVHRRYAATGDAAGALREVQLDLLRAGSPGGREIWPAVAVYSGTW
jgi:CHAT domain-containing protein